MKFLKMSPENAERHRKVSEKFLITIRDEEKLDEGEDCKIEHFHLTYRCAVTYTIQKQSLNQYCELLGFDSLSELESEMGRIYPGATKFVVHGLYVVGEKQEDDGTDRQFMRKLIDGYCEDKHEDCNAAMCHGCNIDMVAHHMLGASYRISNPYYSYVE